MYMYNVLCYIGYMYVDPQLFECIVTFKVNVAVYKDLNIEFVTSKVFVTRLQCKNAIKPYISRAYCLFYAYVRNDFVSDGNRACRATCRVPGSTINANRLFARARRQLPRDRWTQNSYAFTSAAIQGDPSTCTYAYTIIYSC